MQNLTFSGLTISSSGKDYYTFTDWQTGAVDWDIYAIPGARGSVHIARGSWQSQDTEPSVTIAGRIHKTSASAILSHIAAIEALRSDPRRAIGTAQFGIVNAASYSMTNAKLESFIASEVYEGNTGVYIEYTLRFVKVGS